MLYNQLLNFQSLIRDRSKFQGSGIYRLTCENVERNIQDEQDKIVKHFTKNTGIHLGIIVKIKN
jgi:hypothetical protein